MKRQSFVTLVLSKLLKNKKSINIYQNKRCCVCDVIGDRSILKFAFCTYFESRSTNISYLDFSLKPVVFGCLANAIAPPSIALESCSNPQN